METRGAPFSELTEALRREAAQSFRSGWALTRCTGGRPRTRFAGAYGVLLTPPDSRFRFAEDQREKQKTEGPLPPEVTRVQNVQTVGESSLAAASQPTPEQAAQASADADAEARRALKRAGGSFTKLAASTPKVPRERVPLI